jgi:hypothetical protein
MAIRGMVIPWARAASELTMAMPEITVAVVVVTYNSALLLDDLCTSLEDGINGFAGT